jgi:hypothetical protein
MANEESSVRQQIDRHGLRYSPGCKLREQMSWNRRFLKYLFLAVMLLMLYGCPYDSEVPLTSSEDALIDTELIGNWTFRGKTPAEAGMMTISPFNEHELLIIMREEGKCERDYYRAFVSIIDGVKFLNVQTIKPVSETRSWTLVNYSISNSELTIRIVEDKLIKEKFSSSTALREFIKIHLKNTDLYNENDGLALNFVKQPVPQPGDK